MLAPMAVFMLYPATGGMEAPVAFAPEPVLPVSAQASRRGVSLAPCWADLHGLSEVHRPETARQMRIERRVIVRIAPFPAPRRGSAIFDEALAASPPVAANPPVRFEERRAVKCVPIRDITGVRQASDNRLVLFLHKSSPLSARLEKNCRARDFYSGFYVEDSEDGMLCTGRDTLHSRAGANCSLSRLYRLAPIDD